MTTDRRDRLSGVYHIGLYGFRVGTVVILAGIATLLLLYPTVVLVLYVAHEPGYLAVVTDPNRLRAVLGRTGVLAAAVGLVIYLYYAIRVRAIFYGKPFLLQIIGMAVKRGVNRVRDN